MFRKIISILLLIVCLNFLNSQSSKAAAITFLSEVHADDATVTSLTVPSSISAGNTVVVVVSEILGTVTSVSDTGGSVYTKLASRNDPNDTRESVELWGTLNASPSTSVTVNFSGSVNAGVSVLRYSGVTAFGNTNINNGITNSTRTVSVTTQDAGNWVVAGFMESSSLPSCTVINGVFRAQCYNNNQGSVSLASLDNTSAVAGMVTNSYTSSISANWAGAAVELRSSGGTPPPIDTTPPIISSINTSSIIQNSATISWNTDENSDTQVEYGLTTGYGQSTTLNPSLVTSHSANLSGLSASTLYHYRVKSRDASGNLATSADQTFTTTATPPVDTTAPSVPSGLSATAVSASQINLSWTASTDAVGVIGYKIFRGGVQIGTSSTNNYSDTGLSASTLYSYTVSAYDAANNNSSQSSSASTTTQAGSGSSRTFYVDFTSGSDVNNGISKLTPWKRVPGMTGFAGSYIHQAGDTFVFKGGIIWPSSVYPWVISQSGLSGNPDIYTTDRSWYSGASFVQPVFDDNHLLTAGGMVQGSGIGYITINDLNFINYGTSQQANGQKSLIFTNTHDITITNSTFATESWITIYFVFLSPGSYSNFTWTGNDFSHTSGAIWFASAQANTSMHNIIYNNNSFHDYSSQIGGGVHGDGAWHSYGVPDNDSTQYIDNLTFCNNRFYGDFRRSFGVDGAMTGFFFAEDGLGNALICNNDMSFSPVQASMFDGLIVLAGNNNARSGPIKIYNNSLANIGTNAMSAGIHLSGNVNNVIAMNNIISGMQYAVYFEGGSNTFTSDYNLYNSSSGSLVFGSSFQSYAQWQAAGRDIHGKLGVDPSWVSALGNEHLNSSSPAINAGSNLASLGITILNSDRDGLSRGALWDIGAYEFVSGGGDTTAPSVPTGLFATAISTSAINLSWTASTDPVVSGQATSGVTGYRIYRGGVQIGTSVSNSYSDTNLSPSTLYSYTVSAYDAAGNNSAQSSSASATTQSATPIPGDLNLDHIVNSLDFSLMNAKWFQNYPAYELSGDSSINSLDYAILSSNWLKTW